MGLQNENMKGNISSAIFYQQISFKNSESKNKIAMKNFSKNVDVKLWVPPVTYKINAHNMSGVS